MIPFQYLAFETIQQTLTAAGGFPDTGIRYADVVSVINLTDNISYGVTAYAPTVSPFTGNTLTTISEYPNVTDTLTINVFGNSASQCIANHEALIAVLDQASRWAQNDALLAVQLTAQVQCSNLRTTTMIYGGEGATVAVNPELEVPTDPGSRWVLRDVQLTIIRQGRWLDELVDDSDNISLTGMFTNTPVALTFTNTQSSIPAPTLLVGRTTGTNNSLDKPGFVIVSPELYTTSPTFVGRGVRIDDMSTRTATNWTTFNDAANAPFQGTNVLRLTRPSTTDTTFWPTAFLTFVSSQSFVQTTSRLWAVFAGVRNNSASIDWNVRVAYSPNSTGSPVPIEFTTRPVLIERTITTPQVIALGVVPMTNSTALNPGIRIEVAAGAATGSATFDISYVACVAVDSPATSVTEFIGQGQFELINAQYGNARTSGVAFPIGVGQIGRDLDNRRMRAFDSDIQIETISNRAYVLYLFPGTTTWQPLNGGAGAATVYQMRRRRAYRSPQ